MCGAEEIGRKRGTRNLEKTQEKMPIERIGLRGMPWPGLWIFGKPYRIPGRKPGEIKITYGYNH